jgi:D-alanine-D-alanine ligase-like ATP-grasp enzyme
LGTRVVNGSKTVLLETSKAQQASLLRQLGIPHPRTVVLNDLSLAERYLGELIFPVVIKPNCGGSGMGIQKFFTPNQLREAITSKTIEMQGEQLVLLQQFIQPQDDHIVRVETIGGKVIYAMKVSTTGTFNLCPSETCDLQREESIPPLATNTGGYCPSGSADEVKFELYENPPQDVITAVEKIVGAAGLECGGVEYVVDHKGQWYIYDINALSILRATFKEEYGIDGWGLLADFFVQEYDKVVF